MTKKEAAEKLIEQGGDCTGVFCSDCPVHGADCDVDIFSNESPLREHLAQAYLDSLEPPKQKPTAEETEHPSELEIQKRGTAMLQQTHVEEPFRTFTRTDIDNARRITRDALSLELLWDIRELLKHSLDQSYCVEQAINNAGR